MPTKSFFKKNTVLMLKSFIYTAERKSLTEAGKILLLPVSSISRYISDLEKDMQKKLINTLKGKIFLTPEGEKLYRRANKLIKSWDSILSDVEIEKKVIRVASYASAMSSVMPEFVKKMQFLMPDVLIDIQMLSKDEFNKALRLDEIDIGVYAYYKDTMSDKEPDFMYRKIGPYSPKVIVHKDNPFNQGRQDGDEVSIYEVFESPYLKGKWFNPGFQFNDIYPKEKQLHNVTLNTHLGADIIKKLVINEQGFTILDRECIAESEKSCLRLYSIKNVDSTALFVAARNISAFELSCIRALQSYALPPN